MNWEIEFLHRNTEQKTLKSRLWLKLILSFAAQRCSIASPSAETPHCESFSKKNKDYHCSTILWLLSIFAFCRDSINRQKKPKHESVLAKRFINLSSIRKGGVSWEEMKRSLWRRPIDQNQLLSTNESLLFAGKTNQSKACTSWALGDH